MNTASEKLFSWKRVVSLVTKAVKHKNKETSPPVLDGIALALKKGLLVRRNKAGSPVKPWNTPNELHGSFVYPSEVNQLQIMQLWRIILPTSTSTAPRTISISQQVKQLGWKAVLQKEATRLWLETISHGGKPTLSNISRRLHEYAIKHKIVSSGQRTPSEAYIRSHVIGARYWNKPKG